MDAALGASESVVAPLAPLLSPASLAPLAKQQEASTQVCAENSELGLPPDIQARDDDAHPCWARMPLDALAHIFSFLCIYDMLAVVPLVCRDWKRVSLDPVCWRKVDISKWSPYQGTSKMREMLLLVGSRSQGGLKELFLKYLPNESLLHTIACSGQQLEVLRIPMSLVSGDSMCGVAPKLPMLTYLDLSSCATSRVSIQSLGKHCKSLSRLNLSMISQDSKASNEIVLAVAEYLPQLKHFEMPCGWFSNVALRALLEKCANLEYLDIRGCFNVDMEDSFVKEATRRLKVFHPPMENVESSVGRLDISSPTLTDDEDADYDNEDDLVNDEECVSYGYGGCTCNMEDEKSDIDYGQQYVPCGIGEYKLVKFL